MKYQLNYQMNENVKGVPFSCWKYNQKKGYKYPLHCHAYYEISYVTKGKRKEYYDHNYYNADEGILFFFSPLSVHGFYNDTNVLDEILQFSPEFINTNIPNLGKNSIIAIAKNDACALNVSGNKNIQEILNELNNLCYTFETYDEIIKNDTTIRNLKTSKLLLELLDKLFEVGFLKISDNQNNYHDFPIMETVINNILADPCNIPSLKETADKVNVSYYHFSRLFKKTMGINYQEYCNILRLCHAEEMLSESDKSISEIAFEIGYENCTSFIKSFKKHLNMTPSKYRENNN